jgi:CHASE2 domain-containing sensor protein
MEFKNFDLYIEKKLGDGYQVKARSVTMGEAEGVLTLSADCLKIAAELKNLEQMGTDSALPMSLGLSLHECLFRDSVGAMLLVSMGEVLRDDEKGVRIRLFLSPPEVAALPWEVLYDQRTKSFLCTSGKTLLTRYVDLFEPIRALKITPPVKVLVLIPEGSGLDVSREEEIITEALKDLETVQMRVLKGKVTRSLISRALVEDRYHILHFIGHGSFQSDQGCLEINKADGTCDLIPADEFADFFRCYPSLKLIVLNSCQGAEVSSSTPLAGMAPQLVMRGIPAVVAMQYPISDEAALKFAAEFYLKLCKGWNRGQVDAAVSHARNRIHMDIQEPMAFATPVLFMRSETGVIFDFEQKSGIFRRFLQPFTSASVKNVSRLSEVKKTYEKNIEAWQEKTKDADPGTVEEAELGMAQDKQEITAVDDRLIKWNRTFFVSLVTTLVIFLLGYVGLFNFPFRTDDWIATKFTPFMDEYVPKKFSNDLRLILADDGDNNGLGRPGPAWRKYHDELVDALAKAKAKVVVFDLEISEPTPPYDAEFAAAITRAEAQGTHVILGKAIDEDGEIRKDIAEELRAVVNDHWGNIDVGKMRGGYVRGYQLGQAVRNGSESQTREVPVMPSLGLLAVALSKGPTVKAFFNRDTEQIELRSDVGLLQTIPVYENASNLYDFQYDLTERARLTDATRSYSDVYARLKDDSYFRDYANKIVVISFKDTDLFNVLRGEQRYGAEIHANVISNILNGVYVRVLSSALYDLLIVALMTGVGALVRARLRHVFSTRITLPLGEDRKKFDIPGLLFVADLVYLLIAFLLYKYSLLYIIKFYHLVAPFIAYWLTGRMQGKPALKLRQGVRS